MFKILFIRSEHAFLPEIDAYIKYFNQTKEFQAYDSSKLESSYDINDYDVVWEFKGLGGVKPENGILVHDYASLSTGKFSKIKNYLKNKLNPRPDLRVFLNKNVKDGFKFTDNIDYCYRDMGIDKMFLNHKNNNKEFDFVYVGSVTRARGMDNFLNAYSETNPGKLCLVGDVDDQIYQEHKNNQNIIFSGKVPYSQVPEIASKAEYGINFIPDEYPYNIQTSTKLLEYLALDLKIITTDYKWIRNFEKTHECLFYKLNDKNITFKGIHNFNYKNNFSVEDNLWDRVIEQSGIYDKLLILLN